MQRPGGQVQHYLAGRDHLHSDIQCYRLLLQPALCAAEHAREMCKYLGRDRDPCYCFNATKFFNYRHLAHVCWYVASIECLSTALERRLLMQIWCASKGPCI